MSQTDLAAVAADLAAKVKAQGAPPKAAKTAGRRRAPPKKRKAGRTLSERVLARGAMPVKRKTPNQRRPEASYVIEDVSVRVAFLGRDRVPVAAAVAQYKVDRDTGRSSKQVQVAVRQGGPPAGMAEDDFARLCPRTLRVEMLAGRIVVLDVPGDAHADIRRVESGVVPPPPMIADAVIDGDAAVDAVFAAQVKERPVQGLPSWY